MWNRHSTSANLCSGQSQEIDSSDYQLTETQSRSNLKLSTLWYTFTHTLLFPFLIVIQTKTFLLYIHSLLSTTDKQNGLFIKQSAGQMSAAHGQWQASAEQDADPQIAIHYQTNTAPDWCQKKSSAFLKNLLRDVWSGRKNSLMNLLALKNVTCDQNVYLGVFFFQ